MENDKTPLVLRRGFAVGFSIVCGAIIGGMLGSVGLTTGEYHGMKDTNEYWNNLIDKVHEERKNKSEGKEEE